LPTYNKNVCKIDVIYTKLHVYIDTHQTLHTRALEVQVRYCAQVVKCCYPILKIVIWKVDSTSL